MEYIAYPILFVLDATLGYLLPLYCTFKSSPRNQRWLIHWLVFLIVNFTLLPLLHLIFGCTTYWVLKIAIEFGILFVVGNYSSTIKQHLINIVGVLKHKVKENIKKAQSFAGQRGINL